MTDRPLLIRKASVPAVYGFSARQVTRWCAEARLTRVFPSGPHGPCFLLTAELDDLIAKATVPPGKKAGRAPRKKR